MKRLAAALALLLAVAAAHAERQITVDIIPSFVGAGIGFTPQWIGSKNYVDGVVPGARAKFSQHRFVELYGATADVNLLDVPRWEFGPVLSYRFGREGVHDPVVNLLPAIDGGWEAGLFAGYSMTNLEGIPWHLRVGVAVETGVTGGATGSNLTPFASFWLPLSHTLFVGLGGGFTRASGGFMQQRFGVSPEASAASGLPQYSADAGLRQVFLWPAVVLRLDEQWFAAAGVFYQRLTGDAAASPIVTQRGDRNQWTGGVGVGYSWR